MNNTVTEVNFSEQKVALAEKMRYQLNKTSYYLAFLGLGFNIVFMFAATNEMSIFTPRAVVGVKILINILILFITFLSMEKVKAYQSKWAILLIVLGTVFLFRIAWVPRIFYASGNAAMGNILTILLIITSGLYIFAGIIGYIKSTMLKLYMRSINELK